MSRNEPTISGHLARPCSWGTHIEILAAATLFEVPVYEYVQSPECDSEDHWEVHHPLASLHKLNQLPITELHHMHRPPHFELRYIINSHYDCIVDKESC